MQAKIWAAFSIFFTLALFNLAPEISFAQSSGSGSCWTIITYDKDGIPQSGRNCVDPTEAEEEKSKSQTKKRQQKITESGEILIANPPFGTKTKLRQMGYDVVGAHRLGSLELEIIIVKTPEDKNLADAVKELLETFPSSTIDTNDFMDLSSGPDEVEPIVIPFDRQAVGWGRVDPRCGFGLKIGMIDGAVDIKHPTLKGQRLVYKNFIQKGGEEAAFDHGTAVASMLIGKPGENHVGGLLPGARLYAANIFEKRAGLTKGNLSA
ncbi:MAG: S8 family serine peptidase, partial [Alphaproteobacteria bacterium]|nr:S8 family serine peptidase [Alphaproteobacteria bacterium]